MEINRFILMSLLEFTNAAIETAENGQQAVDMVAADPEKYDIIYMDLHMPVMDGYEATQIIRNMEHEAAKNIPIVAMTANAFAEDIRKCLAAGMNDHIAKPIEIDELLKKTDALL